MNDGSDVVTYSPWIRKNMRNEELRYGCAEETTEVGLYPWGIPSLDKQIAYCGRLCITYDLERAQRLGDWVGEVARGSKKPADRS